jgi:2-methylcitrate dehydratase PrpD
LVVGLERRGRVVAVSGLQKQHHLERLQQDHKGVTRENPTVVTLGEKSSRVDHLDGESPSLSERLADHLVGSAAAALPPDVRARAKLCVLDTLGCMIGALPSELGEVVRRYARSASRGSGESLFGLALRSAEDAGLAFGLLAHALEYDDGHRPSDNHLGCVVVPAALAVAYEEPVDGLELLAAVVLGYDVMGKVGEAVALPRIATPFHGTGTTGPFGSAAVAARLWGLSPNEASAAFGLAGTQGAGLRQVLEDRPEAKPLHPGHAVQAGIAAARFARAGLNGPRQVLEGRWGLFRALTPQPRPESAVAHLGQPYEVMRTGFKLHATCGLPFCAIDAALDARAELGADLDDIVSVEVGVPAVVLDDPPFRNPSPSDASEARFSVPYGVAAALTFGRVSPNEVTEASLGNAEVQRLLTATSLVADEEVERTYQLTKDDEYMFYPARVTVSARGRRVSRLSTSPLGYDPRTPPDEQRLRAKFSQLVTPVVGAATASALADAVESLDVSPATDLLALLASPEFSEIRRS